MPSNQGMYAGFSQWTSQHKVDSLRPAFMSKCTFSGQNLKNLTNHPRKLVFTLVWGVGPMAVGTKKFTPAPEACNFSKSASDFWTFLSIYKEQNEMLNL